MSRRSSDPSTDSATASSGSATPHEAADPLRPSDHADATDDVTQPALGFTGWMRWGWRQLTSMRTALVLLLLLAIAAVPGSLVPQRSADPNGVTQWQVDNPDLYPVLEFFKLFDVYSSPWFSAIYILLFVSLIGCVIPRTKHHWKAMRALPPRTPARLERLDAHRTEVVELAGDADAAADAETAVALAEQQLKKAGYRVQRYDTRGALSVSAERGYLRETGNLVFHGALIGVLLAVGIGGGLTYTGQSVIIEGRTFVNTLLDYTSFNPGRFVDSDGLSPYSLTLDSFDVTYVQPGEQGAGQAGDFAANLTTQLSGDAPQKGVVRVNHPLDIAGDRVYLMGNGYAPTLTVRNAAGEVVLSDPIPFLPQDTSMTSLGVVKIPDGMPEQLGLVGFFYPTQVEMASGAYTSSFPALVYPVVTLEVYQGDLGIDDGTPRSVYTLDTGDMEKIAGRGIDGAPTIELKPGETADLPNGLGTITFENEAPEGAEDYAGSVKRYVSLSVHRDVGAPWVLGFALLALAGLLAALFVPRRRMWVKVVPEGGALRITYAGLARGEDPTLDAAVEGMAQRHLVELGGAGRAPSAGAAASPPRPSEPEVD